MRAMRSLHTASGTEKSEEKLGYSRVSSGFLTYSQEEISEFFCEGESGGERVHKS